MSTSAFKTLLHDHLAKDFFYNLCSDGSSHAIQIPDRVVLHEIRTHDLPSDRVQMRNRFADRHASRFSMRDTRSKGGIKEVHIEGDVNGDRSLQLFVRRKTSHLDHLHSKLFGLLALMSGRRTNSYLYQALRQSSLHDSGKRAGMR